MGQSQNSSVLRQKMNKFVLLLALAVVALQAVSGYNEDENASEVDFLEASDIELTDSHPKAVVNRMIWEAGRNKKKKGRKNGKKKGKKAKKDGKKKKGKKGGKKKKGKKGGKKKKKKKGKKGGEKKKGKKGGKKKKKKKK